jgi:hypothetical protein
MSDALVEHIKYYHNHNRRRHVDITEDDVRKITAKEARAIVGRFADLGVVYAFSLDMTESNVASIGADIVKPIGTIQQGLFTVSPSLSNSLSRENLRAFTIIDNFESLRTMTRCHHNIPANIEYPITGNIGLEEELRTFISLTFKENLSKTDDDLDYSGKIGAPAMADTITFTTTVSAGAPPKVELNQVGNRFQFTNASSGFNASRVDKHQVIIGLGLPVDEVKPDGKKAAVINRLSASPFVTAAQPAGGGVANALSAVNQQILRFELPRRLF